MFIPKANNFFATFLVCGPSDILTAAVVVGESRREQWVFALLSSLFLHTMGNSTRQGAETNKLQGKKKMEEEHKRFKTNRCTDFIWNLIQMNWKTFL